MRLVVRTSAPRTLTSNYRYNIAEYAGGMGVAQKHHATTAMQGTDLSERKGRSHPEGALNAAQPQAPAPISLPLFGAAR